MCHRMLLVWCKLCYAKAKKQSQAVCAGQRGGSHSLHQVQHTAVLPEATASVRWVACVQAHAPVRSIVRAIFNQAHIVFSQDFDSSVADEISPQHKLAVHLTQCGYVVRVSIKVITGYLWPTCRCCAHSLWLCPPSICRYILSSVHARPICIHSVPDAYRWRWKNL